MNTHRYSKQINATIATFPAILRALSIVGTISGLATLVSGSVEADTAYKRLEGHVPSLMMEANLVGSVPAQEQVSMAFTLPLRNEAKLDALLARLYNPNDPLYGKYLTPEEFTAQFAPTQADYDAVVAYAKSQGLTVTQRHPNRLLLDVTGSAAKVQSAFGVSLKNYKLPSGRIFRSPSTDPLLPASVASKVQGVVGLDNAAVFQSHSVQCPTSPLAFLEQNSNLNPIPPALQPFGGQGGGFTPNLFSGPGGGNSPADIKSYYGLGSTNYTGTGQVLALMELDGYTTSDIIAYESKFGLTNVPLQNVLVGATGVPSGTGSGPGEVTLDIELMIALAPGASKIMVYEGVGTTSGVLSTYNRIASDNQAKNISTSWGINESVSPSFKSSEKSIFAQMALQGQSIFAASGDRGAYNNGSTLSVSDPASQPYVTGVGGTTLKLVNGAYVESVWNSSLVASGGGISSYWYNSPQSSTAPGACDISWQLPAITSASRGSTTYRNVPDVALNADPNTGYSIYYNGAWTKYGGTSCAAPLWAAFTALVNQGRAAAGKGAIGYLNPTIYSIGTNSVAGTTYSANFNDVADGSTNRFYPAVPGYDLATGWGSFKGATLLQTLIKR